MKNSLLFREKEYSVMRKQLQSGTLGLYEGGARLFSYGYRLEHQGHPQAANDVYVQTIELLELLSEDKGDIESVSDLACIALGHGVMLYRLGNYEAARGSLKRSVQLLDSLLELGASTELIRKLVYALIWYARGQRRLREFSNARASYRRASALRRNLLLVSKDNLLSDRNNEGIASTSAPLLNIPNRRSTKGRF